MLMNKITDVKYLREKKVLRTEMLTVQWHPFINYWNQLHKLNYVQQETLLCASYKL